MQLHELPYDLLLRIASSLDPDSLFAFSLSHPRLHELHNGILEGEPSMAMLGYLRQHGHVVQTLNLSNCGLRFNLVETVHRCQNVRELNLVNSSVRYTEFLRVLQPLTKLETLSFTMAPFSEDPVFEEFGPFLTIKTLYLESSASAVMCKAVVDFLNSCHALEIAHVNFVGSVAFEPNLVPLPPLAAERWNTLHTFICSRALMPYYQKIWNFLPAIFAHKQSSAYQCWVRQDKDCYIYERGIFNTETSIQNCDPGLLESLEFIGKYQVIQAYGTSIFPRVRCPPRSLRVVAQQNVWATELNRMILFGSLTSKLTELDLLMVHGPHTEEFRLSLISAAPSLRSLAVTVCFLVCPGPDRGGEPSDGRNRPRFPFVRTPRDALQGKKSRAFTAALEKLRLEKLYLSRGDVRADARSWCLGCEAGLTRDSMIDLSGLNHLRELNFPSGSNAVNLRESGFENLANRNLRTLRLDLSHGFHLSDVCSFSENWPRLENLKLSTDINSRNPNDAVYVTAALTELDNLKKLCFRTSGSLEFPSDAILRMLPLLPRELETFHLHVIPSNDDLSTAKETFSAAVAELGRSRGKHIDFEFSRSWHSNTELAPLLQFKSGRNLETAQTFIGSVTPPTWTSESC